MPTETAMEGRARRAAQRIGLTATKSRWRKDSIDNYGGFQLVDGNIVVHGTRYDLSAEQVLEWCTKPELVAKLGCKLPLTKRGTPQRPRAQISYERKADRYQERYAVRHGMSLDEAAAAIEEDDRQRRLPRDEEAAR
jgi:hypothetical protein